MQRIAGRFVYSASDLTNFSECGHLTTLDREASLGTIVRPKRDDATADLLARKGEAHERHELERLRSQFGPALVAFEQRPDASAAGLAAAEAATVAAMAAGAPIIFQATFFDGTFLGRADFLRRIERPSQHWAWSYEVIDTKLALSPKPYFLIQLCNYSEHLERIQGTSPENGYIVLGTGQERAFRIAEYSAFYRHLKATFLERFETPSQTYPFECAHCDVCPWRDSCAARRDADDHPSIVAGLRRDQLDKLEGAGIDTLTQLARAEPEARPRAMSEKTYDNLRAQAREQHRYRAARARNGFAKHSYTFRPMLDGPSGFARLPKPAPGDIFFDMEGDPLYRPDRALEYLFGIYVPDEDRYIPFWGTNPREERTAFESFVDFVRDRLERYPDLHVYHYAPYEVSALKRLMGRFASRENEIDDFLIRGTFVDLYAIVRQGLWISQPSYSIKKVEALYGWTRHTQTRGGDDSIVMFESWLETGDAATLEDIRKYNEDDCRSTHALREWLLRLRIERAASLRETLSWPEAVAAGPRSSARVEQTQLEHRFLDPLPAIDSLAELRLSNEANRSRWLLGNLLQYHRREQKPDWWEFFYRADHPDELEFDRKAIAGLELLTDVPAYKAGERDKNSVYTYSFPAQEFEHLKDPCSPYTQKSAGEVISIDERRLRLAIKLANTIDPPMLRALIPGKPLDDKKKREAIAFAAREYLDGNLERHYPATVALLAARTPRLAGRHRGAPLQPVAVTKAYVSSTIAALEQSYLFIQGPPGSGKSTTGAWAIVDLLEAGKRVALAALSHKAVHALLRKIEETACARGFAFRGCHRSNGLTEGSAYEPLEAWSMVSAATNAGGYDGCQLVSGTTFAWAEESQRLAFDYVVIDEAGQISLADALVTSLVAKNVVLLGDPQQLPQVAQGSHPAGASVSILEHLLGTSKTIAPDRGIFLDTSYRMQPQINDFISDTMYDGRLRAHPENAKNRIDSSGLNGGGLRYVPVPHAGNTRRSIEEAERVVAEIALLLSDGSVTLGEERPRRLTERDILVVAPYNMQRVKIAELLAQANLGRVRVGTVDKFQGQEAPVVFYSLATSSGEDAPRGMEFLFNPNRFNVAVSRAQAMSVIVCSPTLLGSRVRSPEQMRLVNLLCAYVERAGDRSVPPNHAPYELLLAPPVELAAAGHPM